MRFLADYLRISFIQSLQYRAELLVWVFISISNLLILVLAWFSIIQTSGEVFGYSFLGIVQYYFVVTAIDTMTASHFEEWRSQEVKNGKIDTLLTKPVSYPMQVFIQDLGMKLFWVTISLPFLIITYLIVTAVSGGEAHFAFLNLLQLIPLLLFAFWFQFCVALMIVFTTFWLEGAEGLQHFKWIVISIFSGLMIPIPFMPGWLQNIVNVLPFKYLFAVPAGIIQGTWVLNLKDIAYMLVVAIVITWLTKILWHKTKLHYASAGG